MVYRDIIRHPSPSIKSYTDLGKVGDFDMSNEITTSNVASMFGVHHNTVRKWVSVLEKRGYAIKHEKRGKLNVKLFNEEDIEVLRAIHEGIKNPNVSLEQAVTLAMEANVQSDERAANAVLVTSVSSETVPSVKARLKIHDQQLQAQLAFNKELVDRLERNQRFIEESIKRRDEQLTQALRGLTEAASSKATEVDDSKPKRRKWFRR